MPPYLTLPPVQCLRLPAQAECPKGVRYPFREEIQTSLVYAMIPKNLYIEFSNHRNSLSLKLRLTPKQRKLAFGNQVRLSSSQ